MAIPQAVSMSPPQPHAQMPQGSLQQQVQQQLQPQEKMFMMCDGRKMTATALLESFDRAKAHVKEGKQVDPDTLREMRWMLQQHYPQHPYLGGNAFEPPQKTRTDVLVELSKRGMLGPVFEAQKKAMLSLMEQRQRMGPNTASNSGQQQHPQQPGKPMWPNARSPLMGGQAVAGQTSGQSSSPPMWPNFTPDMVPNGQLAQRRQVLGGLPVNAALVNGALPMDMSRQQSFDRPQSAHSQAPGSPPSTITSAQGARSASQASQNSTSPTLPVLPWNQSAPSPSQTPSQHQFSPATGGSLRLPSAGPYGQDVRSPSQPSPFKPHPTLIGMPPGPTFRPPSAPTQPEDAGKHLTVPKSRRGSAPAMGMFPPPPPSRSPSFQGETPSLQKLPSSTVSEKDAAAKNILANQHSFLQNMGLTREAIQQLSPKKQQKLKEKYIEWNQRKATSMQPPIAPPNLKRKPGPTNMVSSRPRKQQLTIDLTASHKENWLRRQNEEANCGFGPTTTVIRSNPNSRQPSPQPVQASMVPQLAVPSIESQALVYEPSLGHVNIPEENLLEHAQLHGVNMCDLELSSSSKPTELAQFGAPKADIRAFLDAFDLVKHVARQRSVIGSPLVDVDPKFLVALRNQRRMEVDGDGGDVNMGMGMGLGLDVGEFGRDVELGMSEQRTELEWGLMSVGGRA